MSPNAGSAQSLVLACARSANAPVDASAEANEAVPVGVDGRPLPRGERVHLACRGLFPKGDEQLAEAEAQSFETVIEVEPGSAEEHWKTLRIAREGKGGKTLGVRVLWKAAAGEDPDQPLLGLCRLDVIKAVNDVPVTVDSVAPALKQVGREPETRVRLSRRGRTVVLVFRRTEAGD
jgi:hypothetical protein